MQRIDDKYNQSRDNMESLILAIPLIIACIIAISFVVILYCNGVFQKKHTFKSKLRDLEIKTATLNCEKNILLTQLKELQVKISLLETSLKQK